MIFFLPLAQKALVGRSLLIIEASQSQCEAPHSVELLWTNDQPDAQTSDNTQHSQETTMPPGGIRTRNPSKRAAAYTRGQWDRHSPR